MATTMTTCCASVAFATAAVMAVGIAGTMSVIDINTRYFQCMAVAFKRRVASNSPPLLILYGEAWNRARKET